MFKEELGYYPCYSQGAWGWGGARTALGDRRRRGAQGGGGGRPKRLYKAPTDYTKPRLTIQIPDRLYKGIKYWTKTKNVKQRPKILNKSSNKY